ncbi:hypothetical protein [Microvirga arabica]|uniref:hypothetical protein n=1 Tax=Microvirga arabica TaxID=1128671 RepID=UPI0019398CF1|nr:hypothetical protein [Microvirga arabica]MBM1169931.1 hypothetical protein [Microvirga arabica]
MSSDNEDDIHSKAPRLMEASERNPEPTDYVVVIDDDSSPAMVHPTLWPHAFQSEEAMLSAVVEEICFYNPGGGERKLDGIPEHLNSIVGRVRNGSLDYVAAAKAINEKSSGSFSIVWWGPVRSLLTCDSSFAHQLREELAEDEEELSLENILSRMQPINFA